MTARSVRCGLQYHMRASCLHVGILRIEGEKQTGMMLYVCTSFKKRLISEIAGNSMTLTQMTRTGVGE